MCEIESNMQTFLPYGADYKANAKCLDNKRLGKQRVEGYQILKALLGESTGWVNHPATRMWRGHEYQLTQYLWNICMEWTGRNYKDTVLVSIAELLSKHKIHKTDVLPEWLNNPAVSITHQANLFIKNSEHYKLFEPATKIYQDFICCPNKCNYYWPLHKQEVK